MIKMGVILTLGLGLASCMKAPDMAPDYGPEVSGKEVETALKSAPPAPPFLSMKLGQYVSVDEFQAIDTGKIVTLTQRLDKITNYTVTERDKDGLPTKATLAYTITMDELQMIDDKEVWNESKFASPPLGVEKAKTAGASSLSIKSKVLPVSPTISISSLLSISRILKNNSLPLSIQSLRAKDATSKDKVTYHKLNVEQGTIPIPHKVKDRANCGGILRCDLPLRILKVSFDRVTWDTPEHGTKIKFSYIFSPDIPVYIQEWDTHEEGYALTNLIQACAQIFLEVQNGNQKQTVPILQCSEVRDFEL